MHYYGIIDICIAMYPPQSMRLLRQTPLTYMHMWKEIMSKIMLFTFSLTVVNYDVDVITYPG